MDLGRYRVRTEPSSPCSLRQLLALKASPSPRCADPWPGGRSSALGHAALQESPTHLEQESGWVSEGQNEGNAQGAASPLETQCSSISGIFRALRVPQYPACWFCFRDY